MSRHIEINFSALAERIDFQLSKQGISLDAREAWILQQDAEAISRLLIRGLIPNSAGATARKRLMARVTKAAELASTSDPHHAQD